jgi:hypothetical protein
MQPTPIVLQADYQGDHLQIDRSDAETEPEAVNLPADLTFLATKR